MQGKVSQFLEALVTVVIFLVLVQTVLSDMAVIFQWSALLQVFIFTALFFDLFFTIEFLVRLYNSVFVEKNFIKYFIYERGWIDLLASVPLLIFISGFNVLSMIFGGAGAVAVLRSASLGKLLKVLRITRILRLLRVLKISKIKYTNSKMTSRHVSRIITISVTLIIFCAIGYALLTENSQILSSDSEFTLQKYNMVSFIESNPITQNDIGKDDIFTRYLNSEDLNILYIEKNDQVIYQKLSLDQIESRYGADDLEILESDNGHTRIYFDITLEKLIPAIRQSWQSLFFFILILIIIIFYAWIYSPHFAMTVTDPIHVMRKGIAEPEYNLEVKLNPTYEEDDIYQLAKVYNENFLPLKDRNMEQDESSGLQLDMDDLKDMLD